MISLIEQGIRWHGLLTDYSEHLEEIVDKIREGLLNANSSENINRNYRKDVSSLLDAADDIMMKYITHLLIFQKWRKGYGSFPLIDELSFDGVTRKCLDLSRSLIEFNEILVNSSENKNCSNY